MRKIARGVARRLRKLLRFSPAGPIGLIDVGSVGGLIPPWSEHEEKVAFLLNFEPNDKPKRKKKSLMYNTALWEEDVRLPFHIYKGFNATGSSLFEPNIEYVDTHWSDLKNRGPRSLAETWHDRSQLVRTTSLDCRKLDNVLQEEKLGSALHFLKIDAQGAEGQILRGATNFLDSQCVGLQLELFNIPLYKGIILRDDVVGFLERRGFKIILEMPPHGSFGSQTDCVFLHEDRGAETVRKAIRAIYGLS